MFEDTLLIIKTDYLHKRQPVLMHLLQNGFMIKGQRKILFSPENAAEFYKPLAEDKDFMLQVILLSKGNSEAFILTKENAVEDLIYIPEPIPFFKRHKFTSDPLIAPLISQLYEIVQKSNDETKSWKVQLAEWLTLANPELPIISNACATHAKAFLEDKAQQVNLLDSGEKKPCVFHIDGVGGEPTSADVTFASSSSSSGGSIVMSTSSCMTCRPFERTDADVSTEDECKKAAKLFAPKTAPLQSKAQEEEEEECEDEMVMKVCEDHIEQWKAELRVDKEEMKKVLPYGGKDLEIINEMEIEEEHFLTEE